LGNSSVAFLSRRLSFLWCCFSTFGLNRLTSVPERLFADSPRVQSMFALLSGVNVAPLPFIWADCSSFERSTFLSWVRWFIWRPSIYWSLSFIYSRHLSENALTSVPERLLTTLTLLQAVFVRFLIPVIPTILSS
jgi:hypothetical protein